MFIVEVGLELGQVLDAPRRWPEYEPGVRKFRLSRFPYAILYEPTGPHSVEVFAIFDLRRRPGSWRR